MKKFRKLLHVILAGLIVMGITFIPGSQSKVEAKEKCQVLIENYQLKTGETIVIPAKVGCNLTCLEGDYFPDFSKLKLKLSNEKVAKIFPLTQTYYLECYKKGSTTLSVTYKGTTQKYKIKVTDPVKLKLSFNNQTYTLKNNSKKAVTVVGYVHGDENDFIGETQIFKKPVILKPGKSYKVKSSKESDTDDFKVTDHFVGGDQVSVFIVKIGGYYYYFNGESCSLEGKKLIFI